MSTDFELVRTELRRRTAYLADGKDALDGLVWYKTKGFDRVVSEDDVEEYEEEYSTYSQSQGEPLPLDAPPAPPAATLSAIVRLSNYKYFLTACSDWNPQRHWGTMSLKDVRPSAIAEDPCIPSLADDYRATWDTLDALIKEMVPDENDLMQSLGVIDRAKRRYSGFKIGHKVFEKNSSDDEDAGTGSDPQFDIENWPLTFPDAESFLDQLKSTHVAKPIPAYNLAGHLIRPSRYAAELKGAIVRLEFNFNHWFINSRHVFTADITRIRVLKAPPPFDTPTPRRRRIAKLDDFHDEA